MDLHSPYCTVYEALEFSAYLRLSSTISKAQKDQFLNVSIDVMEETMKLLFC